MRLVKYLLHFFVLCLVQADEHDHMYNYGEEVVLWVNTVGPYHNRQETYAFFSLPYCRGTKASISHYHETLGERLLGVELEFSGLPISFQVNSPKTVYCTMHLSDEGAEQFENAVAHHYWYQMFMDDLPIWGVVGEKVVDNNGNPTFKIFTHKRFQIGFNGQQIVDVNLTSENLVNVEAFSEVPLTYEVEWIPSQIPFSSRFDKYLDASFFQHRIHWFSLFNAFMMVIFLVGLVSLILMRTLRKDYARYEKDRELDELERDFGDEYGWKQIHGDVFRPPAHQLLFASLVGTGCHVFVVVLVVVAVSMLGELYMQRGSILGTIIFAYAALSPVNGYAGGSLYARFGGRRWIRQMFLGASLLPVYVCSMAVLVNFVAIYYHATRAIPFTTMLEVISICIFVILPLSLVGTVLGRNLSGHASYPCRVNAVPRPIPEKKCYMEPLSLVLVGGLLPFGSIFIEVYFIFTSFWAYKIYYVYGFMLLVCVLLAIVTMCVTAVCCYVLLNAEDYRWRWTSFFVGASTAFYVYLYAVYYFFYKTKMYGFFQTIFYFGYTSIFCVALGIMCVLLVVSRSFVLLNIAPTSSCRDLFCGQFLTQCRRVGFLSFPSGGRLYEVSSGVSSLPGTC
ncbi:hypothetical protein M514_07394 [Trichuris suis]|uniref:Transmembrane 9 superfamily member n=1 Tax=Trichuris suis TaxID=68888 RepID=A0A085NC84_9BILA|nr:hypothetical protein M513_07394 [Trichuris suis]KFD67080.1 hypothetical protein M514_07394 [Trichuris suis]